jgi:formamidopyrimidine-DNA glycosylase
VPELPDVTLYVEALREKLVGQQLTRIELKSAFVLRSVTPSIDELRSNTVRGARRLGKRIVLEFDDELFVVIHLMIAGRLRWRAPKEKLGFGGRMLLASFVFPHGTLFLTEASSKKRASIELVRGEAALASHNPGGLEPLDASLEQFAAALTRENHTVKRALTDPHLFSGIGNAYSDEILHAAQLSPIQQTQKLKPDEWARLFAAAQSTLRLWIERLREEAKGAFPEKVTAFRKGMAVHGRFGQPCPRCGEGVLRIRYADNETNYCARCQTGGKVLADRGLSRLLGADWPRTLEKLEALKQSHREGARDASR